MFYDIFISLCAEQGKTPSDVSRELGIGKSTISMWKKQNSIPNAITLMQLAEYFNVAPAYLAGNPMAKFPLRDISCSEEKKPPADIDEELLNSELIERLCRLTPEEMEKVDAFVQGILAAR